MTILVVSVLFLPNIEAQEAIQWKLPEGAKVRLSKGVITDMQLPPDGSKLAIASSVGVRLYDVDTGAENVLLSKNTDLVGSVAFSPDGTQLVYASGEKKCYVWNLSNNKIITTFNTDESSYKSLKILADGKTLVAGTWTDTFVLWDITNGELLDSISPKASKIRIKGGDWHRAKDGVVDETGSVTYAISNHDGTISIQDGRTHQLIQTLVPQTNEDAFLKVGKEQNEKDSIKVIRIPPVPINDDDQKQSPSNIRKDGKPFPIQYRLDQQGLRADFDKQPIKWILDIKFSPDGKLLVSKSNYKIPKWGGGWSGSSGPTELWDVETGEQLGAFPWWADAKFSSDSKTIAFLSHSSFSHGRCDIWDMIDRHQIAEIESITEVQFSGDGRTLYLRKGKSYDNQGTVVERPRYMIWDITSQSEIASVHPIDDRDVLFHKQLLSYDGSVLVTANYNSTIDVWKTKTDTQMRTLTAGFTNKFTALAFNNDGNTLVSGSTGGIDLWNTESGALRNTITTEKVDIEGITFAKDNKKLTTIGFGSTIQWDVPTGEQITSDNSRINLDAAIGSSHFDDGTIIEFSVYAISPNFKTIAAKNRKENGIEIWQTDTRKQIGLLQDDAFKTARGAMALIPDGSILATVDLFGKAHEVFLWDTDTGERIATLNITKNLIEKVFAYFMDIRTYALMFDFSGETLAVGTGKKDIQLWDVNTQKRVRIIKTSHKHVICKIAFSPDGNLIASGDAGGGIHVWNSKTGKHVAAYKGHKLNINVLVFSKNSRYLASTGLYDGTIFLWDLPKK